MLSTLESVPSFGPVVVQVEADFAICFSLFPFDDDGESLPKALKDLGYGDFVFDR